MFQLVQKLSLFLLLLRLLQQHWILHCPQHRKSRSFLKSNLRSLHFQLVDTHHYQQNLHRLLRRSNGYHRHLKFP